MAGQLLRHLCSGFLRILVPLPVPGAGPEPCLCRPHLPVSSSHVEPLIPFPVTLSRMHLLRPLELEPGLSGVSIPLPSSSSPQ